MNRSQIEWLQPTFDKETGTKVKSGQTTHRFQDWLHTTPGRMVVIGVLTVVLAGLAWSIMRYFGPDSAQRYSDSPLFIDSVTGKTFHYQLKIGDTIPVVSPFTPPQHRLSSIIFVLE